MNKDLKKKLREYNKGILLGFAGAVLCYAWIIQEATDLYEAAYILPKWHQTSGILTHVDIKKRGSRNAIELNYDYEVDEQTFTGDNLGFTSEVYSTGSQMRTLLNTYNLHEGTHVSVYYNPAKPDEAYLLNQIDTKKKNLVLVITFSMIPTFIFVLFSYLRISTGRKNRTKMAQ